MGSPRKEVVILCWQTPTANEQNARKIVEFMGARARFFLLTNSGVTSHAMVDQLPACECLIVSMETLARVADTSRWGIRGVRRLIEHSAHVFVFGSVHQERHARILRDWTAGALIGVEPLVAGNTEFMVTDVHREWCGPFSGASVRAVDPEWDSTFVSNRVAGQPSVLITAAGKPFLVGTMVRQTKIFMVACSELANLDELAKVETGLLPWFSRLAPLMMVLHGALGESVWHNDEPRACFIIDDPLLKARYGFLDYQKLVEVSRLQKSAVCVAFIPWNYRRSCSEVAQLFTDDSTPLSLCIHGCDHTRAEFGSGSSEFLCQRAGFGLARMREHQRITKVPFDDVMVFPQGIFSPEAMRALRNSGYLAAVNTELCPVDETGLLPLRELLEPAISRYGDFPLFGRRYPRDVAEFAFDLFLGKPALSVEHHGYFRNGYGKLEEFVTALNRIEERLEWTNVGKICSHTSLRRTDEQGNIQIRFYTHRFTMRNDTGKLQRYVLMRHYMSTQSPPVVTVNGVLMTSQWDGHQMSILLELGPKESATITVKPDHSMPAALQMGERTSYDVLVRRLLSEFRDNYVETNPLLNRLAIGARSFSSGNKMQ